MQRKKVDKKKSAKVFRKNVTQTKAANVSREAANSGPMRGGWRL